MAEIRFDRDKFKELILYLAGKCETDPSFGATKLNKLLYYCDFVAYTDLGQPITGATYQRQEFGPTPSALVPIRSEMEAEGCLFVRQANKYSYQQKRPMALRSADLKSFTGEEVALIDRIIDKFWDMDAVQISEYSHDEVGWKLAREGEAIPYETAYIISIGAA